MRAPGHLDMRGITQDGVERLEVITFDERGAATPRSLDEREPCVGRDAVLSALERLLQSSAETSNSVVVRGEPGIGKTKLVHELAHRARRQGVQVAWGHCYGTEGAPPYIAFQQVFEALRLGGLQGQDNARPGGRRKTAGNELAQFFRDPTDNRDRFVTAIAGGLLEKAAHGQLLVVVEDIQWADVGSLLLLNNLVDLGGHGLMLICTLREGEEPTDKTRRQLLFMQERKSRVFRLRGLGRPAVRQLVCWLCGPGVGTAREIEAIHSLTQGNPLFIREFIAHLRDTGVLNRHTLGQALAETTVPSRLADTLDLRLGSLPRTTRAVLAAASVLGLEFSFAAVSAISGAGTVDTADLIFDATRRGLLHAVDGPDSQRFRFAHPLYWRRLYEALRPSRRQALHTHIAEAVERGKIHVSVEALATHYALGRDPARRRKAVSLCRVAAERAEQVFAYETAGRFWSLAIECDHGPAWPRAELISRLGWALWSSRIWGRAREAWEQAVSLFETCGDGKRVAELALALGETARWQQDLGAAQHWLRRALNEIPAESEARTRALALLGDVECIKNETACGLSLLHEAHQSCVSAGTADPYILNCLAFGYMSAGEPERARELGQQGLRLAIQCQDRHAGTLLSGLLTHIELSFLRFAEAQRYASAGKQLSIPTDTTGLLYCLVSQCLLLGYRGKWARLVTVCDRGMSELRLAGRYQLSTIRLMRAEAILALGNPRAASVEMAYALPGLEALRPAGAIHLARALLKLGATQHASRLVSRYASQLTTTRRTAAARAVLGEIASHLGENTLWQATYELLEKERRPLLLFYSPIAVQRVLGRLAARLGEWSNAEEHFETAITQLSGAGAWWESIQTYLDYSEMRHSRGRRGDSRKALALKAEAERTLSRVGIPVSALGHGSPNDETEARVNRFGLTGREVEVLRWLAEGRRNSEIAEELGISRRTADRHIENILAKMGVRGRVEAVVLAVEEGLVGPQKAGS